MLLSTDAKLSESTVTLRGLLGMLTQAGEPLQRAQPGHEAIFAAANGNKPRQAVKAASDRPLGNGEDALAVVVAGERILLGSVTDEIAVRHPLRAASR